jgi:2-dehydro-3-deoxyphosphooctonate aldolase (KDO 8-P synthase)
MVLHVAERLRDVCAEIGLPLIFKSSFDKANRTQLDSYRGPGMAEGLSVLAEVRRRFGTPVTTDVHHPEQAKPVAAVADLLQIPAMLCRQTDLLVACGETGRPVNLKKGQFMAPWDLGPAVAKVGQAGSGGVMVTERGTCFGYDTLVADLRSPGIIRRQGVPVVFDATHAVKLPPGRTGQREHAPALARAAVAAGVDAIFLEVHPDPDRALSDGPNMLALEELEPLLRTLVALHRLVHGEPT